METLPEIKIQKTGRLGANAAASDAIPHAGDDRPEQPASDLSPASENAETTGAPVPLPETTIPSSPPLATDAAAAGIILRSSNEDPDQVATDLRLAGDYARATGGPVPPLALVRQYRDSFQQTLQEAKNAKILSESPFLANWMLTPENAALAGDDLQSLGWFASVPTLTFGQPAKEGSPFPPEKTVQEVLAEDIAGARGKDEEQIAALEDRIKQQREANQEIWQLVLKNVRDGNITREGALSTLIPGATRLALEASETVKAFPGGVVTGFGQQMEGTSALVAPLIIRDPVARKALVKAIAEAKSLTPKQIGILRDQIEQQTDLDPDTAQTYLSDVLHGAMTPEQVYEIWEPTETPLPQKALSSLRWGGIRLANYGKGMFPARRGMENSPGRKLGASAGSNAALLPAAYFGIVPAIAAGVAQNSGGAASAAREAGQDQHTQTVAAYEGILAGLVGSIPVGRVIPAPVAKAGAMEVLKYLGLQAMVSGVQNAGQQVTQNAIAQSLYDHKKSLMEDVAVNFSAGALVTAIDLAIRMMAKGAKSSSSSGSRPPGGRAGRTAVTVGEISKNALQSKLRQRDPERFGQLVEQLTGNGPAGDIYVPADQFVDYLTKRGLDLNTEVDRLGWTSRSDLDAAIAAGGDLKIPTATYAAKIAGSEHDAFFKENGRLNPDDMSARQAAELKRREEEAQKNAEDARFNRQARDAVEGAEKDAETARVNRESRRFVKEATGDGEAVDVDEQARRAVEGTENDTKPPAASGRRSAPRGSLRSTPSGERKSMPKPAAASGRGSAPQGSSATILRPPIPTSRRNAPPSEQKTMPKPSATTEGHRAPKKPRNDPKAAGADKQPRRGVKAVARDTKSVRAKRKALRPANKLQRAAED